MLWALECFKATLGKGYHMVHVLLACGGELFKMEGRLRDLPGQHQMAESVWWWPWMAKRKPRAKMPFHLGEGPHGHQG
jgi:hypothetical protein